jgi:hypothetical protein
MQVSGMTMPQAPFLSCMLCMANMLMRGAHAALIKAQILVLHSTQIWLPQLTWVMQNSYLRIPPKYLQTSVRRGLCELI